MTPYATTKQTATVITIITKQKAKNFNRKFLKNIYSLFNERMPKHQERYHVHLHISASKVFKKSSFLENKKQRNFKFRQANQKLPWELLQK